jgi:glucose-6-phosphate isomerase
LMRPLATSEDLIVATTDRKRGALRKVADASGWKTLPIDDAVGGRYSVLSAVGLLPIAYAGVDIRALRAGAIACAKAASEPDPLKNPILFYAAVRNILYSQGAMVEVLANFEPRLHFIAEWWKQLFGESEGKNHSSLFPAAVDMTTDLHSMGQYLQEGRRFMLETFLTIGEEGDPTLAVPAGDNTDELGYLVGKPLTQINHAAYEATALAHHTGGLPNLTIHLTKLDAYSLGYLLYFFECACGVSGYLLGVNPFDQPGVEAYKKNMFALLKKPGYEEQTKAIHTAMQQESSLIEF